MFATVDEAVAAARAGATGIRGAAAGAARPHHRGDPRHHARELRGAGAGGPPARPASAASRTRSSRTGWSPRRPPASRTSTRPPVTGDHGLTLTEPAPFGVIGAITPCTNPTSTIICNAIGMLAAGNAVVFNVHPSAKHVLDADRGPAQPRDHRRRRPAQRRRLRLQPDDRVGAGADAPPRRPPARRHRRRRRGQGGDGLGQARDLRRPRQPAGGRRRDRRHRQGRPRHRARRLHRQQHHLRRREGDDLRRRRSPTSSSRR